GRARQISMTYGVHIKVSPMMIDQGAKPTSPIIWNELGSAPVKNATALLNRPICGCSRKVQKLPTTAGDSIIGSRIMVVQKLWPRNRRLISSARPNPSTTSNAIDHNTKGAEGRNS